MRVRMRVRMTGSRGGEDWPGVGGLLDVSDEEGNALLRAGIVQAAGLEEADHTPPTVDEATGRAVGPEVEPVRRTSPEGAETAATSSPGEERRDEPEPAGAGSGGELYSPRRRRGGPAGEPGG